MSLQQSLLMGGGVNVALTAHTISGNSGSYSNSFPPPALLRTAGTARFLLNADGTASWYSGVFDGLDNVTITSGAYSGEWITGGGTTSDYEVEVVVTGTAINGTSSTSGAGVWNNLGTNRLWERTSNVATITTSTLAVTIRTVVGSVTKATATITLSMN